MSDTFYKYTTAINGLRVEVSRTGSGAYKLRAERNGRYIPRAWTVITADEWDDRSYDHYNALVEACWALERCGITGVDCCA